MSHYISSPLNYTGGKFRLLGQILPLFPKQAGSFVDLFCGGCNVGINVNAERVIFNDASPHLLSLYNTFKTLGKDAVLRLVDEIIEKYGLSRSAVKGYAFYGCESSAGLGGFNRERFLRLRAEFNAKGGDLALYVLIVYAFNNQIRFNGEGKFNLPVGKRDFNDRMKSKLCAFVDRLREGSYSFVCRDFRDFDTSDLNADSLVYCDPPYLITCAAYNERDGWNERSEKDLLAFLDGLDARGIRFALSNVLTSKGRTNEILAAWAAKYRMLRLDRSYSNSN